ncbi:MAG: hypothetical protein AAB262_08295, partial [Elusimicrobiota bacterium]
MAESIPPEKSDAVEAWRVYEVAEAEGAQVAVTKDFPGAFCPLAETVRPVGVGGAPGQSTGKSVLTIPALPAAAPAPPAAPPLTPLATMLLLQPVSAMIPPPPPP